MNTSTELDSTIRDLMSGAKGLLAADESTSTIAKRLKAAGVASTEDHRRAYRLLLLSTPGLADYVSGIILFEETLAQRADDGTRLGEFAARAGFVPGVKVDAGKMALASSPGESITQGLDDLSQRLDAYKQQGARFAKWRAVFNVSDALPSRLAVIANAVSLARYAAICQSQGVVPIVEPEVLMDGTHTLARCADVTESVLRAVFAALSKHGVALERMLLKPNMVVSGAACLEATPPTLVAEHTLRVLRRTVPASVPGVVFLSGGQTPAQATANLDAINRHGAQPWPLSFSYGRALQEPVLAIWRGSGANVARAQEALLRRARLNCAARLGRYDAEMESSDLPPLSHHPTGDGHA